MTNKNIRISALYSKADILFFKELEKHLNLFERKYQNVEIWSIDELVPGDDIRQQISFRLTESDVVLTLLSVDFVNDVIVDEETRLMLQRFKANRPELRQVLPVIIRNFDWQGAYNNEYDIEQLEVLSCVNDRMEQLDGQFEKIIQCLEARVQYINRQPMRIVIPTWIGYLGLVSINQDIANDRSMLSKKYNREVTFRFSDSFEEICRMFKNGEVDVIGTTIDSLPSLVQKCGELNPKIFFKCSNSIGADKLIGRKEIKSLKDLEGKKVLTSEDAPFYKLLQKVREKEQLDFDKINFLMAKDDKPETAIKQFLCDPSIAAVTLWTPYSELCLTEMGEEAKVLISTKDYPNLVVDVLVASQEYIALNREELEELVANCLGKAALFHCDKGSQNTAIEALSEQLLQGLPGFIPGAILQSLKDILQSFFKQGLENIWLGGEEDNMRFFIGQMAVGGEGRELLDFFQPLSDDPKDAWCWENIAHPAFLESFLERKLEKEAALV